MKKNVFLHINKKMLASQYDDDDEKKVAKRPNFTEMNRTKKLTKLPMFFFLNIQ